MKNLKKLVSVVLTLALLVSTFATSALAVNYADVETTNSHFEAIDILSGLGILKGDELGNFNPTAEIKRSEVAAVIARALGSEDAAQGSTGYSAFADVSADHWAVGYINWAAQQGIVNGRDAQTFDPDASVKYQEVIKMLVAALGYDPLAQKKGGYPTGYMVIASSNAITKGISLAGDANAPREIVAQAVYNALEVPLMDATIITTSGDDEYAIYNGKGDNDKRTVLSYYLEIAKVEAQVIATTRSAIEGDSINVDVDDEEEVKIKINSVVGYDSLIEDDDSYYNGDYYAGRKLQALCGGTGAESLLGYNVIAYIGKDADEKDRVFAITPDTKKTDILEAYDWVNEVSEADEGIVTVGYYVDGDTSEDVEEIEVDEDAVVVENGKVVEDYDLVDLTAANDVVFMDANDDEVYDYVFVKKYVYDVVEEVDAEEGIISVEDNGEIDVTDEDVRYTLTFNGEAIEYTALQENDVLNIIADAEDLEDAKYVDIIVTRDTVEGTITREEEEDGVTKYVIDGTGYEYVGIGSVALKDEGTFYLTIDGKIAKAVATVTAKDYAFVTEIEEYDEFGTTYYVQMVTDTGAVREYAVASSVKVKVGDTAAVTYKRTGSNVQSDIFAEDGVLGAKVAPQATEAAAEATIPYRFVTYTLNASGEISALNIAKQEKDTDKTVFDAERFVGKKYTPDTDKFADYFYKEDTKLFAVSVSENRDGFVFDTDDVTVMTFDALDVDEENYTGYRFSTDKDKNFGAAVITNEVAPSGIDAPLAIVKAVLSGENAAGENADGYKVLQAGKEVVIYEGEDFEGDDLAKGDIFYYSLDSVGDIKKLTKVYDVETNTLVATEYDEKTETGFVIGLATYDGGSKYIKLETPDAEDEFTFAKDVEGTFALVDTAKARYSSYITALSSAAGLKASKDKAKYVTVAKVVDGDITDAIQYLTEFDDETDNFGWDGEPEYDIDWDDSIVVEEETEAPSEEVPSEEVPSEEVPSEEVPSEEVPSEEVPSEEVPSEEPSEEVPSEEPSVEA